MKCKKNCNYCLPNNALWKMSYIILATLERKYENEIHETVNDYCPNLTVCPECRVDDFVHVEGCSIDKRLSE